jgi:hypothetical protein
MRRRSRRIASDADCEKPRQAIFLKMFNFRHPDVRKANARRLQRVSRTEGFCALLILRNTRSLTSIRQLKKALPH